MQEQDRIPDFKKGYGVGASASADNIPGSIHDLVNELFPAATEPDYTKGYGVTEQASADRIPGYVHRVLEELFPPINSSGQQSRREFIQDTGMFLSILLNPVFYRTTAAAVGAAILNVSCSGDGGIVMEAIAGSQELLRLDALQLNTLTLQYGPDGVTDQVINGRNTKAAIDEMLAAPPDALANDYRLVRLDFSGSDAAWMQDGIQIDSRALVVQHTIKNNGTPVAEEFVPLATLKAEQIKQLTDVPGSFGFNLEDGFSPADVKIPGKALRQWWRDTGAGVHLTKTASGNPGKYQFQDINQFLLPKEVKFTWTLPNGNMNEGTCAYDVMTEGFYKLEKDTNGKERYRISTKNWETVDLIEYPDIIDGTIPEMSNMGINRIVYVTARDASGNVVFAGEVPRQVLNNGNIHLTNWGINHHTARHLVDAACSSQYERILSVMAKGDGPYNGNLADNLVSPGRGSSLGRTYVDEGLQFKVVAEMEMTPGVHDRFIVQVIDPANNNLPLAYLEMAGSGRYWPIEMDQYYGVTGAVWPEQIRRMMIDVNNKGSNNTKYGVLKFLDKDGLVQGADLIAAINNAGGDIDQAAKGVTQQLQSATRYLDWASDLGDAVKDGGKCAEVIQALLRTAQYWSLALPLPDLFDVVSGATDVTIENATMVNANYWQLVKNSVGYDFWNALFQGRVNNEGCQLPGINDIWAAELEYSYVMVGMRDHYAWHVNPGRFPMFAVNMGNAEGRSLGSNGSDSRVAEVYLVGALQYNQEKGFYSLSPEAGYSDLIVMPGNKGKVQVVRTNQDGQQMVVSSKSGFVPYSQTISSMVQFSEIVLRGELPDNCVVVRTPLNTQKIEQLPTPVVPRPLGLGGSDRKNYSVNELMSAQVAHAIVEAINGEIDVCNSNREGMVQYEQMTVATVSTTGNVLMIQVVTENK